MIVGLKAEIIKNNNHIYLNTKEMLIEVKYYNYCEPDNDQNIVYVKKHTFINEKQTIVDNVIVFLNLSLLHAFEEMLNINGFGLKTAISIFNNNPRRFIQLKEEKEYDKLKNEYKLNIKQINSIMQIKSKQQDFNVNKKMNEITVALENLGYKKTAIRKCLTNNPTLLEEPNFSILLKKFVEKIKNEI